MTHPSAWCFWGEVGPPGCGGSMCCAPAGGDGRRDALCPRVQGQSVPSSSATCPPIPLSRAGLGVPGLQAQGRAGAQTAVWGERLWDARRCRGLSQPSMRHSGPRLLLAVLTASSANTSLGKGYVSSLGLWTSLKTGFWGQHRLPLPRVFCSKALVQSRVRAKKQTGNLDLCFWRVTSPHRRAIRGAGMESRRVQRSYSLGTFYGWG